ncbi:MAG TPA: sugar transferase [Thermoanaerobaculia bacterium]|nr:sugar transferase [Thermoanaerobaculia bacterium]
MSLDDTGSFSLILEAPLHVTELGVAARAKRAADVVGALALLILTMPLLTSAALLVRLTSRGPAFFVQPRIGHRCRRFPMLKLRTMVEGAERQESAMAAERPGRVFFKPADDPRVTRVGRWLRRTSIDELPQLINVLRGEMSLVGPRPLLLSDFDLYPRSAQLRRFAMKPGITGLWQVSGRSRLPDERRIELDLEYVDHWSLGLDARILLRTLPAVASGDGAS